MSLEVKTHDTDFACALMARGARLVRWERNTERNRLVWNLSGVDGRWIEDFRAGTDGIAAFVHARRMLVSIAKTET